MNAHELSSYGREGTASQRLALKIAHPPLATCVYYCTCVGSGVSKNKRTPSSGVVRLLFHLLQFTFCFRFITIFALRVHLIWWALPPTSSRLSLARSTFFSSRFLFSISYVRIWTFYLTSNSLLHAAKIRYLRVNVEEWRRKFVFMRPSIFFFRCTPCATQYLSSSHQI